MTSIFVPLLLAVMPTTVSTAAFWLFVAAMTAVSLAGLHAGTLAPDARFAAAPAVAALYAAARMARPRRSFSEASQPFAIAAR